MAVDTFYPDTIPLPLKQGYVLKPRPNVRRTELEQGAGRVRRNGRQKPTELAVVWELTQYELMLLQGFHEHQADEGTAWFGMRLLTYVGLVICEVRFKGEINQPKQAGHLWQVSATLEVREIPRLSEEDYAILVAESGDALFAAIPRVHHVVATALWPSLDDDPTAIGEDVPTFIGAVHTFHPLLNGLWSNP
ncbi:hypothetical protein [Reyranella massiliensis]|uniref:hypothetical protein n=1 Tax=Reyranella massiliensis TaxID=445220 RepID=UPI0002D98194|nr:hypothetical protein [Reyranella massiliensis]